MNERLNHVLRTGCAVLGLLSASAQAAPEYETPPADGREVSRRVEAVDTSRDRRQVITILVERDGKTLKRVLESDSKRYDGVRKDLMRFQAPTDVRGVKYLTFNYEDPARHDDMWVFMPANNLLRRISGNGMRGVFMRSDLYNEDLRKRELDDDTHRLLRTEPCLETRCYVVERRLKDDSESNYGRRLVWVRGDIWLPVRIEYYDKQDRLLKVDEYSGFEEIQGIWMRTRMDVTSMRRDSHTTLLFSDIRFDQGLSDDLFLQARLRR
ncbi:hypothetical protein ThidrDRAFT_3099 [Thiorhodococcus drewsii AZ1]|uniref:Uncharacterized protein TP-0789 domain-containing protein n=1 Tax=Thiorhodococcus drewsii AZ1 TaxID=765913 RepID=G2E486_9GAMM|nr:outer membrane lipoprotein-sorting protein [Thiorhodococcus drewsii]EGV29813.1 hypothetical protein ThidrDRAFT_3099 [Thiorhodococcus drewsii AZ1]